MTIEIQRVSQCPWQPKEQDIKAWASLAIDNDPGELTVRLVDSPEMTALNETYRHKKGPTNVLSFECNAPDSLQINALGDVVICLPVIIEEATCQQKNVDHHFAHILIHGILHLKGFDHQNEQERAQMEALEIKLLKTFNILNPYEVRSS